jgi:hypothetical protein
MTTRAKPPKNLTLKDAFDVEFTRRETERREREAAERRQQEQDLANAEALFAAVTANPEFLVKRELIADRRRYTVSLDHRNFRIAAYFEAGVASITLSDKRTATTGTAAPRKQEKAESVEAALNAMAAFLADETR